MVWGKLYHQNRSMFEHQYWSLDPKTIIFFFIFPLLGLTLGKNLIYYIKDCVDLIYWNYYHKREFPVLKTNLNHIKNLGWASAEMPHGMGAWWYDGTMRWWVKQHAWKREGGWWWKKDKYANSGIMVWSALIGLRIFSCNKIIWFRWNVINKKMGMDCWELTFEHFKSHSAYQTNHQCFNNSHMQDKALPFNTHKTPTSLQLSFLIYKPHSFFNNSYETLYNL